jgi:antitoxin component YwqK of YwqJK toxin-antitoxin module
LGDWTTGKFWVNLNMDEKNIIWNDSEQFYCEKNNYYARYNGLATLYGQGNLKSKGTIKDGEHNGVWTFWYKSGQKQKQGECVGSTSLGGSPIPIGIWTFWNESGAIMKQGEYKKRRKQLISNKGSEFYTAKDGIWIYWNEDGNKIKEGIFKNGKEDIFTYYNEEGNINGRGKSEYFSPRSRYDSEDYDEGNQPVGKWTYWYNNGKKSEECTYRRNNVGERLYHDLFTKWYENGQKWQEARYKWGVKVGIEMIWNEDGTIKLKKPHGRSLLGRLIR